MSNIAQIILVKTWLFQAIVAGPTFVLLGLSAMVALWDGAYWSVYEFTALLFTSLMSASIVFIVLVQRQLKTDESGRVTTPENRQATKRWTFWFELAKSILATGLWVWLICDSLFARRNYWSGQRLRIIYSLMASVLLMLFYPTAIYAYVQLTTDSDSHVAQEQEQGEQTVDEQTPLLENEQ